MRNNTMRAMKSKAFSMNAVGMVFENGNLWWYFSSNGFVASFLPGNKLPDETPAKIERKEKPNRMEVLVVFLTNIIQRYAFIEMFINSKTIRTNSMLGPAVSMPSFTEIKSTVLRKNMRIPMPIINRIRLMILPPFMGAQIDADYK